MKTSQIITAAALAFAAITGAAHAESYQGVQEPVSALSRADVQQQAVATAHAANQNVSSSSVVLGALTQGRDRATVQAEAIAAARNSTQNLNPSAFVGSQIPTSL